MNHRKKQPRLSEVKENGLVRTTISLKALELALLHEIAAHQNRTLSKLLVHSALSQTEKHVGESLGNCEIHFEGINEYSVALKLCAEFLQIDPLNKIIELRSGKQKEPQRLNASIPTFASALIFIDSLIQSGATIIRFSFYHSCLPPPPEPVPQVTE